MGLAIFDLDNTLIAGDSDFLWGEHLVALGVVDAEEYAQANRRFYEDYKAGRLDIHEYARFAFRPLAEHPMPQLLAWRSDFLCQRIRPLILPAAQALVDEHRRRGDTLLVITATNRFVTTPIVQAFGIEHLLATEPRRENGRFVNEIEGIPCFQEGKVARLEAWLREQGLEAAERWFYSDSHNDLPLLERVEHPVAVDPDPQLAEIARERGWPVRSLRGDR